jgi:uncharacterized protein YlbG (UPF0298 family)
VRIKKYGLLFYNPKKSYAMQENPNDKIKELLMRIEELEFEKEILLTVKQVLTEDLGVDVKKYLPEQLNEQLTKHIKKNQKKV